MAHATVVYRTGMMTAVGISSAQTYTSVTAGLAGFKESSIYGSGPDAARQSGWKSRDNQDEKAESQGP